LQEFEKSEEAVKDGMDIALCSIEGQSVSFAGANNPLWIIRSGATEIEEIKPDKQPIGSHVNATSFRSHTIPLTKGDRLYLFSDGLADQFGGTDGKKFKIANLRKILLENCRESMSIQCTKLENSFNEWKGSYEQVDDVCVIGIRI
jgi:serine phosphatase RsbU (regulator of sigma subunit)